MEEKVVARKMNFDEQLFFVVIEPDMTVVSWILNKRLISILCYREIKPVKSLLASSQIHDTFLDPEIPVLFFMKMYPFSFQNSFE